MTVKHRIAGAALALATLPALFAPDAAQAQAFPSKPIRIIVPFTPGAFNDALARTLTTEFGKGFAPGSFVENKPGGNTVIGTDAVAKAAPDGYTLLGVALPFSTLASLSPQAKLDPVRDFTPVTFAGFTPNILVVNNATPYKSVKELIAAAKAKPGTIPYASTGTGSSNHLSMELFKSMAGIDLVHIPYKGSAPALTDLIGGQVQAYFDNTPNVLPHIKVGKIRALAVTSAKRFPLTPDLPTMAESGVPGYEVAVWFGTVAPAGTPHDVVLKINTEINRILTLPEVKDRFNQGGIEIVGGTPEAFGALIRKEAATWAKVVKDANIKAD
ncbi:MAG TPA: tripartite tricarboxylate transporter substrate binding protein [Burkholderiales bacterium]|jgi:tripartite-type tricarboxylate transporter receptor subunit TctC|nr:tripartite tricarboxylate transporter substrate binding protein [Burkholderiales bacterium]